MTVRIEPILATVCERAAMVAAVGKAPQLRQSETSRYWACPFSLKSVAVVIARGASRLLLRSDCGSCDADDDEKTRLRDFLTIVTVWSDARFERRRKRK